MKATEFANASVAVELGSRGYEIAVGEGLLKEAGKRLRPLFKRPLTAIVTDSHVAELHLEALRASLASAGVESRTIVVPAGEATKRYRRLAAPCDGLLAAGIERRDVVIALGGGVIGDLAGFAAAILRRGVDFIQIPTTLLAQVDSSVGGKTGINSPHGKNLIGAFHQPRAVLIDISLLDTLPRRELQAGYAEIAKYGLLGDARFFDWLEAHAASIFSGDAQARIKAVTRSCEMKAEIVAQDETETGVRALLNLGHTFAHALEAATGYSQRLLHGEAVAIGMAQAFRFSQDRGLVAGTDATRVERHLREVGLPTRLADIAGSLPEPHKLLEIMRQDKKAVVGKLTFILARGIGQAFIARDVEEKAVLDFLAREQARA